MAIMTIRSTYALDPESVAQLETLARNWGVSKSEALRRAIRAASSTTGKERVEAFRSLRKSVRLTPEQAQEWQTGIRQARRR
jgi:hypothetical protein